MPNPYLRAAKAKREHITSSIPDVQVNPSPIPSPPRSPGLPPIDVRTPEPTPIDTRLPPIKTEVPEQYYPEPRRRGRVIQDHEIERMFTPAPALDVQETYEPIEEPVEEDPPEPVPVDKGTGEKKSPVNMEQVMKWAKYTLMIIPPAVQVARLFLNGPSGQPALPSPQQSQQPRTFVGGYV